MSNQPAKKPKLALSVEKVPGGWSLVEYHILDGKILKRTQTEPDYRDIALEHFMRRTTTFWLDSQD